MRPGVAVTFLDVPCPSSLPLTFPRTVGPIGLLVGGFVLGLHFWIPTAEIADRMAAGERV